MADPLVVAIDVGATKTLLTVRTTTELASGWQASARSARAESEADPAVFVDWVGEAVER